MALPEPELPSRTLWMGELEHDWTEEFVRSLFAHLGTVENVSVIIDKSTGYNAGYGFIDFRSPEDARYALAACNGRPIPGTGKMFRLNWSTGGRARQLDPEFSVFVGDLSDEVDDILLYQTFATRYYTIKSAKVMTDPLSGYSRGYGFVRFGNKMEADRAVMEMNGMPCGGRPIRVSEATPRKADMQQDTGPVVMRDSDDPNNTTIFVAGLPKDTQESDLMRHFGKVGQLLFVKKASSDCAFVQFAYRSHAEHTIKTLHNGSFEGSRLRLSWGKADAAVGGLQAPGAEAFLTPQAGGQPAPNPNPYAAYDPSNYYAYWGMYGLQPQQGGAAAGYPSATPGGPYAAGFAGAGAPAAGGGEAEAKPDPYEEWKDADMALSGSITCIGKTAGTPYDSGDPTADVDMEADAKFYTQAVSNIPSSLIVPESSDEQ